MNIGLIADDSKKNLMQNFCIAYRGILCKHNLFATGTTGRIIEDATALSIHKYLNGELGGTEQLGSQIESNDMDLIIYLRDPEDIKSQRMLLKNIVTLSDAYSIPLATNLATAELLIKSLERGELEWRDAYRA